MTPPKIDGQTSPLYSEDAGICLAKPEPKPENLVCSLDSYTASRPQAPDVDIRRNARKSYLASLNRQAPKNFFANLGNSAFGNARPGSPGFVNPGYGTTVPGLAAAAFPAACGNEHIEDSPADDPLDPNGTDGGENPPPPSKPKTAVSVVSIKIFPAAIAPIPPMWMPMVRTYSLPVVITPF